LLTFLKRRQPLPGQEAPARLLSLLAPLYEKPRKWSSERRETCAQIALSLGSILDNWDTSRPVYLWEQESLTGQVANAWGRRWNH
jgi:hypothetical protein